MIANKKKIHIGAYLGISALILVSGLSFTALSAHAQTSTGYDDTATSSAPVLYNQNGQVVNGYDSTTGTLNPGWYYNASGQPVYYYSNGTYYDETTGTYGGQVYYPNGSGTSGVAPVYPGPATTVTTTTVTPTYTTTTNGTGNMSGYMATLYNSAGQPVNTTSGTSLPAGYYYLSPGGDQVYYYGNGTYYDPTTGTYGGSVNNPSGLAGTYYYNGTAPVTVVPSTYSVPGVPDTGLGGLAVFNWIVLAVSGLFLAAGAAYIARISLQ